MLLAETTTSLVFFSHPYRVFFFMILLPLQRAFYFQNGHCTQAQRAFYFQNGHCSQAQRAFYFQNGHCTQAQRAFYFQNGHCTQAIWAQ